MNGRETVSNVALIPTTLLVLRNGYLTNDQVRHALNAYTLSVREARTEFLPLVYETVIKALRVS